MARPLINVGHGSGQPAGMPDFFPVNPWGRRMPAAPRPERPDLFQVVVRDKARGNQETRIGPQWAVEFAEHLRLTIAQQIALGAEQRYSNPVIIRVTPELGRPVF